MQWYLPHHAVVHPQKPDKIRMVFVCSATIHNYSLNQQLRQGPDLFSLIGVLIRIRKERFAMVSGIESISHQVRVDPKDQTFLRFLWWPQGDTSRPPQNFCMTVLFFGATSLPSYTNFGLMRTVKDNSNLYNPKILETVKTNCKVKTNCQNLLQAKHKPYICITP